MPHAAAAHAHRSVREAVPDGGGVCVGSFLTPRATAARNHTAHSRGSAAPYEARRRHSATRPRLRSPQLCLHPHPSAPTSVPAPTPARAATARLRPCLYSAPTATRRAAPAPAPAPAPTRCALARTRPAPVATRRAHVRTRAPAATARLHPHLAARVCTPVHMDLPPAKAGFNLTSHQ
ncbi:hypothetical protein GGX14DRAFT_575785 [Mycena pura]|uniref:Uncharacterized protein n=1 Tax=Mycena pura TaxID=153505 RepID=A0AAD6Y0H5_9AGAR|nr:hypothetical protein GGX14DRAFT_575785 [Mycena pura]